MNKAEKIMYIINIKKSTESHGQSLTIASLRTRAQNKKNKYKH